MIWLIKRLRAYHPIAIRHVGFFWLLIALNTGLAFLNSENEFIIKLFNHNSSALLLFTALSMLRGALGLLHPKLYWKTFRAGLFIDQHNNKRVLFLMICTIAWAALSFTDSKPIPDWIILWGISAWLWLIAPYTSDSPDLSGSPSNFTSSNEYAFVNSPTDFPTIDRMNNDDNVYDNFSIEPIMINPATGLPMVGGIDSGGHLYGSMSSGTSHFAESFPTMSGVDTNGNPL